MTAIFLFAFFFCGTLTLASFKKAHSLKDFDVIIKGRVIDINSTDEGVFLIVEYFIEPSKDELLAQEANPDSDIEKQRAIYKHRFSPNKLPDNKLQVVFTKFINSGFHLLGKKENDKLVQIAAYSNVKLFKWLYLVGSLIAGYFLFV